MANTTNYNWETPDDTDLVKDGAAAIRTLGNSIDTTTKNLNPETTTGDIAYRSATANTNTRLPIGSAGQVLTVAAGVPSWATPSDQTPLTTKGDLFTFTTIDARLGVGANGTVLTADSAETTGLKWAAPATSSGPAFRATRSASAQTLTTGSYVKLAYDVETFDTDSCYDPTTNYRFTPNKAGYYFVYAGAYFGANSASSVLLRLYKNGSVYLPAVWANGAGTNQNIGTTGSSFVYLDGSTDYIEVYGYHGGTSPIFGTDNEVAQFSAFWVRS